jgi:cyclophilin family peptidyl-prolyl cis-trans isomerase
MADHKKVYTDEHLALVRRSDEIAIVTCDTTKGTMTWELYRYWSPAGYDRLVHLLEHKFYDNAHFFRTVPNFLVQFGISYSTDSALQQLAQQHIPDDPQHDPLIPFTLGTISYAGKSNIPSCASSTLCT